MQNIRKKLIELVGEEELEKRVKQKQEQYSGFLNEDGALYAVAREEGLAPGQKTEEFKVEQVYPKKQFGENKYYSSLILSNENGKTRLVFWNSDADKAQEYSQGEQIKVTGAREKNGKYGRELHYAKGTTITRAVQTQANKVRARVVRVFPRRFFKNGVVRTAVISVEGREKRLVMWGDRAFVPVSQNEVIEVEGAVEKNQEIHTTSKTRITPVPGSPDSSLRRSISELFAGELAEIRAVITSVFKPRIVDYCPKHNKTSCECSDKRPSPILSLVLSDRTGSVPAVVFFDTAEDLLQITGQDLACGQNDYDTVRDKILGEEKLFYGMPRQTDAGTDFVVRGFYDYDLEKELEVL